MKCLWLLLLALSAGCAGLVCECDSIRPPEEQEDPYEKELLPLEEREKIAPKKVKKRIMAGASRRNE